MMNGIHLCNQKVLLLRSILDMDDDIKIVLSTAWRVLYESKQLADMLYRVGLGTRSCRIIDRTPSSYHKKHKEQGATLNSIGYPQHRGLEIQTWLEENRGSWTDYVILDDSGDMTEQQVKHTFVQTDAWKGLTEEDCQKMCDILGLGKFVHTRKYLHTKEEIIARREKFK